MSLDSRADVIPYARFLDVRQRRLGIATAIDAAAPPPTDVSISESPSTTIDAERVAIERSGDCDSAAPRGAIVVSE
jgi:hypothetical protein